MRVTLIDPGGTRPSLKRPTQPDPPHFHPTNTSSATHLCGRLEVAGIPGHEKNGQRMRRHSINGSDHSKRADPWPPVAFRIDLSDLPLTHRRDRIEVAAAIRGFERAQEGRCGGVRLHHRGHRPAHPRQADPRHHQAVRPSRGHRRPCRTLG